MARFVLVTTGLIQRIARKLGQSSKTLQNVEKGTTGFLSAYKGAMGRLPPEDKWPIPKALFDKLLKESKMRPRNLDATMRAEGRDIETPQELLRGWNEQQKQRRVAARDRRRRQSEEGS